MNTKYNIIPFNIILDLRAEIGAPYAVEITKADRDHLVDGTLPQSAIMPSLASNADSLESAAPM